jgi:hypothetical protein
MRYNRRQADTGPALTTLEFTSARHALACRTRCEFRLRKVAQRHQRSDMSAHEIAIDLRTENPQVDLTAAADVGSRPSISCERRVLKRVLKSWLLVRTGDTTENGGETKEQVRRLERSGETCGNGLLIRRFSVRIRGAHHKNRRSER